MESGGDRDRSSAPPSSSPSSSSDPAPPPTATADPPALPPGARTTSSSTTELPPAATPTTNAARQKRNSLADMEKMRHEIRQLHEKRAATMMNEVVELQRERDMALARVKLLKQTLDDFSMENTVLKETVGRGEQVHRLFHLEKSLVEEQLYSSDLKRKLQAANKQVISLKAKLKDWVRVQRDSSTAGGGGEVQSAVVSLLGGAAVVEEEESVLERSRSMNDLEQEEAEEKRGQSGGGGSPPSHFHLPRLTKQQRGSPKVNRTATPPSSSLNISKPPSANYSPSPTVIPRRYKLAAVQSRSVGTQVDVAPSSVVAQDTGDNAMGKEIEKLKEEKVALENALSELNTQREEESTKRQKMGNKIKHLQTECDALSSGLSEFSRWARQKLQLVEEDIDICRIVYTLHGSLSQEAAVLQEMREKVGGSEQRIADLTAENRQLRENAKYFEDKYRQMKQLNELQKEKIVLLTPMKSPKQTFYSPSPLTSSPKTSRHHHHHHNNPAPHPFPSPLYPTSSPITAHRGQHAAAGKYTYSPSAPPTTAFTRDSYEPHFNNTIGDDDSNVV